MNVKNDYYINCGSWKDDDDGIFLPERNIGKGIAPWPLMCVCLCVHVMLRMESFIQHIFYRLPKKLYQIKILKVSIEMNDKFL